MIESKSESESKLVHFRDIDYGSFSQGQLAYVMKVNCNALNCDVCSVRYKCYTGIVEYKVRSIWAQKGDSYRALEIAVFGDCKKRFTRA